MAANKFATMVHRNTNRITLVLVYAILEWTLIVLLLLNSLFSYLIIKFADYFGLKPPCPWCSRIDHFLEPEKKQNSHRDHICEHHAKEISKLGYCSNHGKLAQSKDMCRDCLSSQPGFREESQKFAFFRMEQIDMIGSDDGEEISGYNEVNLKCSCCGEGLVSKSYSPYVLIDSSWDVLEYTQKGNLIKESEIHDLIEKSSILDRSGSDLLTDQFEENSGFESQKEVQMVSEVNEGLGAKETEAAKEDSSVLVSKFGARTETDLINEDNSSTIKEEEKDFTEIISQHLEFFVDYSGNQLVPIELIDSTTEENEIRCLQDEEDHEFGDYQEANVSSEPLVEAIVELVNKNTEELLSIQQETEELHSVNECTEELHSALQNTEGSFFTIEKTEELHPPQESAKESKFSEFDFMEMEETENSLVFHAREFDFLHENVAITQATRTLEGIEESEAEGEDSETDALSVHEEVSQIPITEHEADVSIGTEIPDLDSTDEIKAQENFSSYGIDHEEPSTSTPDLHTNGFENAREEGTVELRTLSVGVSESPVNNESSFCCYLNEMEEVRTPDTPTSSDSFNQLHKKLLLLERRESGAEESLDGSVLSDLEGGDMVNTAERLKSALRAERKALHALYTELEEERSASAVAANQTMAMITRLQEEKAAMQMEALQYQRMMEEQSEYDQEALQLLNELMVKREREKQELEKELEVYRRKVLDYETKEKMRMLRRSKDGSARSEASLASCSHSDDGDGMSIDLNQEAKEDADSFDGHQESGNHNTPADSVLNLEDSLIDFEEERMSILDQLKILEERLFTLTDAEDQQFEDIRPIEDYYEEIGKHLNGHSDLDGNEVNGIVNGFPKEMNGKLYQDRRTMGVKAKRLLPLFDAISTESDDGLLNGNGNGNENENANGFYSNKLENSAVARFELEKKRIDIEEEVDQLYGRLQALEADREFLKHCVSSLKKGDKGMDLLQEILQHLRDLRNVELRVKNFSDGPLA